MAGNTPAFLHSRNTDQHISSYGPRNIGKAILTDHSMLSRLPDAQSESVDHEQKSDRQLEHTWTSLENLARDLAQLPPHDRLILRTELPIKELKLVHLLAMVRSGYLAPSDNLDAADQSTQNLIRKRALKLADDVNVVYELALDLVEDIFRTDRRINILFREMATDTASAPDIERASYRATIYSGYLAQARNLVRELIRTRTLARNRATSINQALDIISDSNLAPIFVFRALSQDIAVDIRDIIDSVRKLALDRARAIDHSFATALGRALKSADSRDYAGELVTGVDALEAVTKDFTTDDLTGVDLHGLDLRGVLWSTASTRWPSHWENLIVRHSRPVDAVHRTDLYEVRNPPHRVRHVAMQ